MRWPRRSGPAGIRSVSASRWAPTPCRAATWWAWLRTSSRRSWATTRGCSTTCPRLNGIPSKEGVFIRTRGEAARFAEMIRRRLQQLMPGASYVTVTPLRDILGEQTRSWQLGATMFLAFGALALALAAIGLYSVMAYTVSQRTQELGVRAALGAQQRDLVRLVVREGLTLGAAGTAIAVVCALAAGNWLGPLLFQESPHDPLVFGFVTVALLGVTVVASFIPSRRAARVDPMVALRYE